ncbi:MAG: hypothetical protein NTV61_00570 [Candidatus Bathyarchaeota archaeon]|jgi:hypothetical protein|nr:hypothetical protein [Candidatus Bathyarchaeota archaeon]
MAEQNSPLILIATIVSLLPGAYFAWMVLKGLILTLRGGKDDDL